MKKFEHWQKSQNYDEKMSNYRTLQKITWAPKQIVENEKWSLQIRQQGMRGPN